MSADHPEELAWEPLEDATAALVGLLSEDRTVLAGSLDCAYLDDPEDGGEEDPNAVLAVGGVEPFLSIDSSLEEFYGDYAAWVSGFAGASGCSSGFSDWKLRCALLGVWLVD